MSKTREERREFWRQLIAEQQQSGLPVRVFCQQHRASEYSFYHWRERFAQQLPVKFALVETSQGTQVRAETVEVVLTSGERLRITDGIDHKRLILARLKKEIQLRRLGP